MILRELMLRTTLWQRCLSCANLVSCLLPLHSDKGVLLYLALSGHAQLGAPHSLNPDCLVKKRKKTSKTKQKHQKTKNHKKKLYSSTPNFNLKRDGQIPRPEVCLCGSRTATRTETALFVWPFPSSCSAGTPIFSLQRIFSVARAIRVFTVHKAVYLAAAVCTLTRKETFSFSSYHAMHRGRYISKPGWSISG